MKSFDLAPTRVRTAIALSIAAHLCVLALLAVLLDDRQVPQADNLEDSPTLFITTIVHRQPAPRRRPLAAVTAAPRRVAEVAGSPAPAARATFKPIAAPAPERPAPGGGAPSTRSAMALPHMSLALVAPPASATPVPSPTAASPTTAPTPTPIPTATPTPAATATPIVASANFGGLFSQDYPPALAEPSELDAIRSQVLGHLRIRVDVDETGHATDVRFVPPVPDETLARQLRSELLALHYVPADCNGLHCDGTLEIRY